MIICNRFAYVGSNPPNYTGPSGLCVDPLLPACVSVSINAPWVFTGITLATSIGYGVVNGPVAIPTAASRFAPIAPAITETLQPGGCAQPMRRMALVWRLNSLMSQPAPPLRHPAPLPMKYSQRQNHSQSRSRTINQSSDSVGFWKVHNRNIWKCRRKLPSALLYASTNQSSILWTRLQIHIQ